MNKEKQAILVGRENFGAITRTGIKPPPVDLKLSFLIFNDVCLNLCQSISFSSPVPSWGKYSVAASALLV